MPSEKPKSKEDTWSTDELNKALRRDRYKDDRDQRRKERQRDELNGDEKHRRRRDDDEKRRNRDDDRKSKEEDRRKKRDRFDSPERVEMTEEERERQRKERRAQREGKDKKSSGGSKPKDEENRRLKIEDEDERPRRHRDDDDREKRRHKDDDREKRRHRDGDDEERRREEDRERRRKEREDRDKKRRPDEGRDKRKTEDDRERRHRDRDDDDRRRHRDDDDREKRRHRDDDREKRKHRDEDDRERRPQRDDDEEERERQRRERREKKEGKSKEKESEKDRHRDRREERRRKEDEEDERILRRGEKEQKHSRDSKYNRDSDEEVKTSHRSSKSSRKEESKPAVKQEEDEYNYDEEEFEDYEEDFEDEDEEDTSPNKDHEMNDILRALDQENDRLLSASKRRDSPSESPIENRHRYRDDSPEPDRPRQTKSHARINFVSAKQRVMTQKATSKMGKRAIDLKQMIELDVATFDLFDMPPVKEYDLYIRSFGRTDTTQAYVQTNDDNVDRDIQTDEIDYRQKWTQHPAEDFIGCGRGDGEKDLEEEEKSQMHKQHDIGHFNKFIQSAGQVISILLEEERSQKQTDHNANQSHISISQGFTKLSGLNVFDGRYVQFAHFAPTQPNMLLTVYSKPQQVDPSNPVSDKGIVCVWNTNEPSYPQRILACESQPTCCCFSPYKTSVAFAGMVDGSICVWDLREPSSLHRSVNYEDNDHVLRFPTYNTAGVLDNENHHSAVSTLNPIVSYSHSSDTDKESSEDVGSGLSFQLVSSEEHGMLHFWVVAELAHPDMAGSEMDLGLSPGGRVKLVKSSFIKLENPQRDGKAGGSLRTFEMQISPYDPNHYYVGTDLGCVLHGLRFGSRAYPHLFSATEAPVDVLTIDFSPFGHPCFLVSCSDSTVHLYNTKHAKPLVSWYPRIWGGNKLRCVRWSPSRPCVFYVLDTFSNLYIFDVLENDVMPSKVEQLSKDRVMHITFTAEHKSSGPGRLPKMLISCQSGDTEIHTIDKQFGEQRTLEDEFLPSYLDRF